MPIAGDINNRVKDSIIESRETPNQAAQAAVADDGMSLRPLTPATTALARTVDPTLSASTEIVLNAATKFIRVYATGQDVYLKWGADDVTASNFDEICPVGQVVDFYVPFSSGTTRYTAINLIERASAAAVVVIEK